jgi:type VI secretion system protein ImpK
VTDAFAELVAPLFGRVVALQQGFERGEHPALEPVRAEVLALLAEADARAAADGHLARDFALARAALVYWTDEVLINSSWSHAAEWGQHILEWDLYRERLRADRFYERAAEAERLAGTDPLETFFLAVALGFRGRLALDPAELRAWADRVYARIAASRTQPERFLPEEPRAGGSGLEPLPGKAMLLRTSVLVSVTAIVTLACFLLSVHLGG